MSIKGICKATGSFENKKTTFANIEAKRDFLAPNQHYKASSSNCKYAKNYPILAKSFWNIHLVFPIFGKALQVFPQ